VQQSKYNYIKVPLMNMEGLYTQCSQKTIVAQECTTQDTAEKSKFLVDFSAFGSLMAS
jgi:hypothetical protein